MRLIFTFPVLAVLFFLSATAAAEGLIYQLPDDGAWVRFEVNGKGLRPDGTETVTVKGTQTISSVGQTVVKDEKCRWIELQSQMTFQRAGAAAGKQDEIIKLLVPEKYLKKGENPRDYVLKAFKGASAETIREIDLKGDGAREIQSLDEVFHPALKDVSQLPATTIKTKQQSWSCEGSKGKATSDGTTFTTETRVNNKAPFGVVTYKYQKERSRDNKPQGSRIMEWKFVESGKGAKSAAPDAK